jgi:hypothetical protein
VKSQNSNLVNAKGMGSQFHAMTFVNVTGQEKLKVVGWSSVVVCRH